jgi:predicted lactoylglutathione lyase
MSRMIFVNLPVKNLPKSVEFFTALGFEFNPQFTDEKATCMVISEQACVMLLVEPFFRTFIDKEIADAVTHTETIVSLSAETRAEVDDVFERAVAAGARPVKDPQDEGFMYSRTFQDLDGHLWDLVWMDPSAIEQ